MLCARSGRDWKHGINLEENPQWVVDTASLFLRWHRFGHLVAFHNRSQHFCRFRCPHRWIVNRPSSSKSDGVEVVSIRDLCERFWPTYPPKNGPAHQCYRDLHNWEWTPHFVSILYVTSERNHPDYRQLYQGLCRVILDMCTYCLRFITEHPNEATYSGSRWARTSSF